MGTDEQTHHRWPHAAIPEPSPRERLARRMVRMARDGRELVWLATDCGDGQPCAVTIQHVPGDQRDARWRLSVWKHEGLRVYLGPTAHRLLVEVAVHNSEAWRPELSIGDFAHALEMARGVQTEPTGNRRYLWLVREGDDA